MNHAHDALLQDFGRIVGLEGLAFDEHGSVHLGFDDIELVIDYVEEHDELVLHAELGPVPPVPDPNLFRQLLEANLALAANGLGTLGLDAKADTFVFLNRIVVRGLSQDEFQRALRADLDRINFWRSELAHPTAAAAGGGSGFDLSELMSVIRA